ncbi:zinc-ribbon domain-containing protein, partial [Tyzzerella nexilis]|nr:zinc-ribbon domain-containing protein [[Clostridium] nexile]MCB7558118.1 zinc-ribbon domain-containing protein [[Clostridium] nexile]MCC3677934.1 zinc-ribbon domain-containing protein [[Clostridium] nexile]
MSNSLSAVHPELIAEWSEKNLPLTPDNVTFGSNKKVWWKGACGHEWETSVKARSNGEKCPICSGARVITGINDLVLCQEKVQIKYNQFSLCLAKLNLLFLSHFLLDFSDILPHIGLGINTR